MIKEKQSNEQKKIRTEIKNIRTYDLLENISRDPRWVS